MSLLAVAGSAFAAPVSVERAKAVAQTFFQDRTGVKAAVSEVVSATDTYYVINMSPKGWVIVSADDVAEPVLGYNPTSRIARNNIPVNMQDMLGAYSREIKAITLAPNAVVNRSWGVMESPFKVRSAARAAEETDKIEPLIKAQYDQSSPYNYYCPKNGQGQALVGCVAVAMSQAMSVQLYPAQPKGSVSYSSANYGRLSIELDAEKEYDWNKIINGTSDNYREAARLLYHAGMSVSMDYGIEGSGIPSSQINRVTEALVDHFGYSERDVKYHWRSSYTGDWENLILNELNAGRAVVYNAIDTKGNYGHSFNVDGYNGNRMYHVNWGWGGTGNGYFRLDNLADARMGMNYDAGHVAVVGIGSPDRELRSIDLSDHVVDAGMPAGTAVGLVTVNGEEPLAKYSLRIRGPYNKTNGSYDAVPFTLDGNLLVTTQSLSENDGSFSVSVIASVSGSSESLTSTFDIIPVPKRSLEEATSLSYDRAVGEFSVKSRLNVEYSLTGANGVKVAQGVLSRTPVFTFKASDLSDGDNTLTLSDGSETKSLIIVR